MALEVLSFAVTVPAGTAESAYLVTDLDMPPRIVRRIRWRVPPGPAGELGWALGAAGAKLIPWGDSQWIIADDESDVYEPENVIESGAWQVLAYNTGTYDHTVYLTFSVDPPVTGRPGQATEPLPLVGLIG